MRFPAGDPTQYLAAGTTLLLRINPWSPVSSVLKFFRLTWNMRDRQIVVTDCPLNSRPEMCGKVIVSGPLKFSPVATRVTSLL